MMHDRLTTGEVN